MYNISISGYARLYSRGYALICEKRPQILMEAQEAFKGVAERLGLKSEQDVDLGIVPISYG